MGRVGGSVGEGTLTASEGGKAGEPAEIRRRVAGCPFAVAGGRRCPVAHLCRTDRRAV